MVRKYRRGLLFLVAMEMCLCSLFKKDLAVQLRKAQLADSPHLYHPAMAALEQRPHSSWLSAASD